MPLRIAILFCCAIIFLQASPTLPATQSSEPKTTSVGDALVGAWRLVSIETIRKSGEIIYPFYGKHPEGLLMYDRSGWMSVQIVSDPKPRAPLASSREGFLAAPSAEKVSAAEGYYAYFGTWTVDPSSATVTHHILQSLYPGERNEEGVRHLVLQGNRITLTAKTHETGEDHERRLVWERVAANH